MAVSDEYFPGTIARDFFWLMCGEFIGYGSARKVYACEIRSDLVVKFETADNSFQNVMEWETWCEAKDREAVARWLAPCVAISGCGNVLLQKRTLPPRKDEYPDKIPQFLTDMKYANFGSLDGRLVCHDYGRNLALSKGISARMRKADWWRDTSFSPG